MELDCKKSDISQCYMYQVDNLQACLISLLVVCVLSYMRVVYFFTLYRTHPSLHGVRNLWTEMDGKKYTVYAISSHPIATFSLWLGNWSSRFCFVLFVFISSFVLFSFLLLFCSILYLLILSLALDFGWWSIFFSGNTVLCNAMPMPTNENTIWSSSYCLPSFCCKLSERTLIFIKTNKVIWKEEKK